MRCLLALLCLGVAPAAGDDWPQWLGPNRDGLTAEKNLRTEWPAEGPEPVWLFRDCGIGYSGPAIAGGKLFIMGARDGVERLLALDPATGTELWSADLGEEYDNGWGNGPRATPTVDGDHVYALAAKGALVCLRVSDGNEVWRTTMQAFGGKIPTWGYSESALIDGGRVMVTPGGDQGAVVALDKQTGQLLWQSKDITDGAHYSSILIANPHGQKQYVQLMPEHLIGLDPETGDVLWQVEWPGKVAVIPTPLVQDNRVYVTSGYGVGCMLVEIATDNSTTVVYDNKAMKNHHGGVLLRGDHVYGHSDGVGWLCQEFATGKRVWRERAALGKGALAHAGERFVCLSEDEGEVVLIEASPQGWTEHGRFTLTPQTELRKPKGKIWTHPVIANGRMYLRDQELLFSFDISAE